MVSRAKVKNPHCRVGLMKINAKVPVQMSFNATCKYMTETYGHYDYYFYYPSDVSFDDTEALRNIFNATDDEDGIVCPGNLEDLPYMGSWASYQQYEEGGEKVSLPITYACNAVCLIFTGYFAEKYNYKPWTDILKTNCSEILLTYCCAAIGKKYSVIKNVLVKPGRDDGDGPTLFSRPNINNISSIIHIYPFNEKYDFRKIIQDGQILGLGFNEYPEEYPPNMRAYNGIYAKTKDLYYYLLDKLYIKEEDFNYNDPQLINFQES